MPATESQPVQANVRAMTTSSWGDPDVLKALTIARPRPGPTEILVAVHAAGVNPTDRKSARLGGFGRWGDPPILGYDVSGMVEAMGLGDSLFQPGDAVFGMPRFPEQAAVTLSTSPLHRGGSPASPRASTTCRPLRCRSSVSPHGRLAIACDSSSRRHPRVAHRPLDFVVEARLHSRRVRPVARRDRRRAATCRRRPRSPAWRVQPDGPGSSC